MNDHPIWDYFDYRKAAIGVLQDYATQAVILQQSGSYTEELKASLTSIGSPRIDGIPRANDPHAGESRVCSILDNLDALKARDRRAQAYMAWFNPAWESLSDEDRLVLETFFLDDLSAEDAAVKIAEHFYVERKSAFAKKQRALTRFARLLYGRY
ncbi:hypothetical protein DHOM_11380 [Dermabacter hominis 1368]|uniref:Uncharacterized protein n=1 Tax=Dermabacter hominis 1368 TaxID=1450519 RepID=A0ABR4SI75_9MICO|nr:hypothetical protein DHOM_11380 [Dermabacter hominis 1368]